MLFKHRHLNPEVTEPRVEGLLQAAHASFEGLCTLRARVASSGIDLDELPDDLALHAFALLGDHERGDVAARVASHLAILMGKGLITNTDIKSLSTPVLRFFSSIEDSFDGLLDISQRIEAGISAWQAGERPTVGPTIRCASVAEGLYGQKMRLKPFVPDAEWLLIRPDPIFFLAESLLRVEGNFEVTIPCDDGEVLFAAMSATGDVSVHTVRFSVLQEAA